MKVTLIALGAGCLLMAGSAMAGPCTGQIDVLSKQVAATDAAVGPANTVDQTAADMAQGTAANQAGNANTGYNAAADALQQARMADQAGDATACMDAIDKAEDALKAQP